MKRGVLTAGRLLQEEAQGRGWCAMVTLTYKPGSRWHPRHIAEFTKRCRSYLGRRRARARYVWVLETTRAGVPHYHCLVWLPFGIKLPKPDVVGWWPHGLSQIQKARSALGYLAKYLSKGQDDPLPRGSRLHGSGGLTAEGRRCRSWHLLPRYIRSKVTPEDRAKRCPGGGWVSRDTGEWWPAAVGLLVGGVITWAAAEDSS